VSEQDLSSFMGWYTQAGTPELTVSRESTLTKDGSPHILTFSQEPHSISVLQDFSAPVTLQSGAAAEDHLRLMRRGPNAFNRWEAGQALARGLMIDLSRAVESGQPPAANRALEGYVAALGGTLSDPQFENGFKALALTPPADMDIMQSRSISDPLAVSLAGGWLRRAVGDGLAAQLIETYHRLQNTGPAWTSPCKVSMRNGKITP